MAVFFLINGMLLIMFDVLVPIEICAILFLSSSISFSQAVERKQSFRLHQTTCLGFLANLKLIRRHMFLAVFWSERRLQFFQELFTIWTLQA